MAVAAFISFVIAAVVALVNALGTEFTDNPVMWTLFFVALGLALAHLPPITVRRSP